MKPTDPTGEPRSLLLEELTALEIAHLIESGWTSIIVPLGAIEQHGPGLPLNVDVLHGRETALRAAARLDRTLVAPAVQFGYSVEHTAFAGTITLRPQTIAALIEDVVASLVRSGFRFVYFWYGHGGDFAVVNALLDEIDGAYPGAVVTGIRDVAAYVAATWDAYPATEGVEAGVAGSHAGEFEASMTLAIAPGLVRRDALAAGNPAPLNDVMERMMSEGIDAVSANGVLGDQRAADAERGNRYLDVLADYLVADLTRQREDTDGRK